MTQTFIQAFTHLKDRPNGDRALHILQRVASLVKPIMRKHGWNLPVLAEFFPESPNLLGLNINGGQKICLRLRPAHAPDTFIDEEDVVQTMLHELTHNVHGPHDEKFYKYLSGLQEEYDALQRSGYAGEGFFSKGHRVGVGISHDLSPHQARLKALEAAEKRKQISRVLGRGGRLGGKINTKGLSPRELAAQAAEQRAHDEKACGSGALADREAAQAEKDGIENKVIDLTTNDDSDPDIISADQKQPQATPSKVAIPPSKQAVLSTGTNDISSKLPARASPVSQTSMQSRSTGAETVLVETSTEWSCPTCTLINPPQTLQCDACLTERPQGRSSGWTCLTCGEAGMPHERWSCQFCGTIKATS